MKTNYLLIFIIFFTSLNAQTKFKVIEQDTENWEQIYSLVDENNHIIKVLDKEKYIISFNDDEFQYFAVFGIKNNSNWVAIDVNENVLFNIYNSSFGEVSPDYLVENKIRIVDENNKIGFANEKGKIIIKPQFEIVTSFSNGYAIIGESCENVPWGSHEHDSDCKHYTTVCNKHGYIDEKGKIIKLGNYTFEEIKNEINWKFDY